MRKGPTLYEERSLDPAVRAATMLNESISANDVHEDITIVNDVRTQDSGPDPDVSTGVSDQLSGDNIETPNVAQVPAEVERTATPVLGSISNRAQARLLIITRDSSIRELGSLSQRHMLELGVLFSEIHVIVLNMEDNEEVYTVRLAENIWLYSTHSEHWWKTVFDARKIAQEQLVFGGNFRPDIIVAHDPFESGLAALWIGKTFERPIQVHVHEDFFDRIFINNQAHNDIRAWCAPFVLKRAHSIRVSAPHVLDEIVHAIPRTKDYIELLPTYFNLRAWRDMVPTMSLKVRYPQFRFIMLHISTMAATSHTAEVIAGAAPILQQYPTVGLVIVGSGSMRGVLEKQVISLGIQYQVEFEPTPEEHISHMKSANVLVHMSVEAEEDVVLLEAASVRLPIIACSGGLAEELFVDGESAFLCPHTDPIVIAQKINACLNENQSRVRYALAAQTIVFERIEQDYRAYLEAYRNSIERALM